MSYPVLYSFRRCPYAIRARMAVVSSGVEFELREIALKEKPQEMLRISPKGTVPVAQFDSEMVIEESLELLLWLLAKNDPGDWLKNLDLSLELIYQNDSEFKYWLDRYKYHVGYPEHSQDYYRSRAADFLQQLENRLSKEQFLIDRVPRLADVAVFPFVRQFAFVDKTWFDNCSYPKTRAWLNQWLDSDVFQYVMSKFALWVSGSPGIKFSGKGFAAKNSMRLLST